MKARPAIAIHGGAGNLSRRSITRAKEAACRTGLERALQAGYRILAGGGSSLEAVVAAVAVLEDAGSFNAGRGAVRNAEGEHELDASIMDGASLRAGAVAGVGRIRNPVLAARAVMEHGRHVLLIGAGAERFARSLDLPMVSASYFRKPPGARLLKNHAGTVGAVALDAAGNLAAATSTGGMSGKLPGRVGDSPLIGAGTYADNSTCAVSGTGLGEAFIRTALAHDVHARMKYRGDSLKAAASAALNSIARIGADGGLIAIDRRGNIAMPFNSGGMYRGSLSAAGRMYIGICR